MVETGAALPGGKPSRRVPWVLVGSLVVLAAVLYLATPAFALMSLRSALRSGDRDRLDEVVDFVAVRADLKGQLSAQALALVRDDPELRDNAFAALGAALAPALLDRAIDAYVTPDGIASLIENGGPPGQREAASNLRKANAAQIVAASHLEYLSFNRFRARFEDPQEPSRAVSLVFERRGLIGWKLIRIGLPSLRANHGPPTVAQSAAPAPDNAATPTSEFTERPGDCENTEVAEVTSRLDGMPESGSAISYTNGKAQVSYDKVPGIDQSQPGDAVRLCVVSLPEGCPPGDKRGIIYSAVNARTGLGWKEADSEHMCGGA